MTWCNGTTGTSGVVSSANSLVGSVMGDTVGWQGVIALTNGNYVVDSDRWNGQAGAATWGNGATGIFGVVSAANSLVGESDTDLVGSNGVVALTNGNYVVVSPGWSADASTGSEIGAITWGDGTMGITGVVSTSNSLVGANPGDSVGGRIAADIGGGVTALTNGNYVVDSPYWGTILSENADKGGTPLGAVTWEDGTKAAIGTVNAANSLVGDIPAAFGMSDGIGVGGVTALANGNYVVDSPGWGDTLGAVTWGNGMTGITGTISSANSLLGSFLGDMIGNGSGGGDGAVTALTNGNYVVASPDWLAETGAVTFGNGTTGISGTVSAANSLVGNTVGDHVGGVQPLGDVTALANGNYVVLSLNTGTLTWGNGATGIQGTLSSVNSLTGVGGAVRAGLHSAQRQLCRHRQQWLWQCFGHLGEW